MINDLKVFIFGAPRSGTSIAYYAMREVFGLKGFGESHVFPIFQRMFHQFYTYKIDFDETVNPLARHLDVNALRESFNVYIRQFYGKIYPSGCFVDKTPGAAAIRSSDFIYGAFPEAKTIIMQRNGIEVVSSHQRKFGSEFDTACQTWALVTITSQRLLQSRPDILLIDQFDLTNNSAAISSKIATYLGQPSFEFKLANFFSERRVGQNSSHDWTRRLRLEDTDWTEDQKLSFRMICGEQMQLLGYSM